MLIAKALQNLYHKITGKTTAKTNIAQLIDDLAQNYPAAGSSVFIDKTLTQDNQAADAKTVGTKLGEKIDKTTAATTQALGLVKQAAAVADAAAEQPTKAEFNALLNSLRNAGVLSR